MARKAALELLKTDLENQCDIATITKYYVKLPLSTIHKEHVIGSSLTISHNVDKRVIEKIHELVGKNVTRPNEVRRCLNEYVEKDILSATEECYPKPVAENITPRNKICATILQEPFLHKNIVKMTRNHCSTKLSLGNLMKIAIFSIDQQEKPIQIAVQLIMCRNFSSSTRNTGSDDSFNVTARNWF